MTKLIFKLNLILTKSYSELIESAKKWEEDNKFKYEDNDSLIADYILTEKIDCWYHNSSPEIVKITEP